MALIERIVRDPQFDLSRLEHLYKLRAQDEERRAAQAFAAAMAAAQSEMTPVVRNRLNPHTRNRYADLAAIADAIQPIYTKHHFSLTFAVDSQQPPVTVVCEVMHAQGHIRRYPLTLPLDAAGAQGRANKTALQAMGSTLSYARRYLTCLAFNVATFDDDDGAAAGGSATITEAQEDQIREALEAKQIGINRFCAKYGLSRIGDLPASRFAEAMTAIARHGGGA